MRDYKWFLAGLIGFVAGIVVTELFIMAALGLLPGYRTHDEHREPKVPASVAQLATDLYGRCVGDLSVAYDALATADASAAGIMDMTRQCQSGWQEAIDELVRQKEWRGEWVPLVQDWLYGDQDPDTAHDLLFCILGEAKPFANCMSQMEGAR